MLDSPTRRRIDTARDILVGKVPDPKSQVEQITIALIYKFMDDMDKEAVDFGGLATFFTGDYAIYAWTKIFDPKLGGYEMLNLYSEAILKLNQNPNIPQLFRDIFKNAYLPYRDPETLKLFLKTINEFKYDHSEMLGDAFEYLLSVLGSQGDAGQFRTPRHIIDFMVQALAPKKGETICDPACGTAGFLISSYKYIVKENSIVKRIKEKDHDGNALMKEIKVSTLTPDDRKKMMKHFTGFDISPDMVRLSLVNMYLHGFTTPKILEYDTLTSEERWNEYYDIILANPPFMTPKGGIKPHKKFTIQAKKSEVLFTDYIAEHINPTTGRAAIIVPNGIVATSQTAYKQLRKMLVHQSLIAVVSLPAGVFQPYSGVKTSVLILDRRLSKKSRHILFLKIENDGFDLGAQRREIDKNDLPQALAFIETFKNCLNDGKCPLQDIVDLQNAYEQNPDNPKNNKIQIQTMATLVEKEKVLENKDVVLSAERYFEMKPTQTEFETIKIGDVFKTSSGGTPLRNKLEFYENGIIPWLKSGEVAQGYIYKAEEYITEEGLKSSSAKLFPKNSVLVAMYGATAGQVGILKIEATTNQAVCAIYPNEKIIPEYLYWILKFQTQTFVGLSTGGGQPNISQQIIRDFEIPLPPIPVQQQIVCEIESYQKIIDGARQIVNNYNPVISINPEWELVELGEVIDSLEAGVSVNSENRESKIGEYGILKTSAVTYGVFLPERNKVILSNELKKAKCNPRENSIIISRMNTEQLVGASAYIDKNYPNLFIPDRLWQTRISRKDVSVKFIHFIISSPEYREKLSDICAGTSGSMKNITKGDFLRLLIPLPSIAEQQSIVKSIEEEMQLIAANKKLIELFEQKIKNKISEVWGVKKKVKEYKMYEDVVTMVAEE
jgi:type I restriction enzyme M protein